MGTQSPCALRVRFLFIAMIATLGLLPSSSKAAVTLTTTLQTVDHLHNGGGVFVWTNTTYSDPNSQLNPQHFPGFSAGNFNTFCIERNEHVGFGGIYSYTLTTDIANNPSSGAMGATAENNLRLLFGTWFPQLTNATDYQAFQMSIWEIVADSNTGLNLANGGFTYSADINVQNRANQFLGNLGNVRAENLIVLTAPGVQDQIGLGSPVPCPPALFLALVGLAPMGIYRRLRSRRNQEYNMTS